MVVMFCLLGVFLGADAGGLEDENNILDPTSSLGVFLRRCILAFNLLSFEVQLLLNIKLYLFGKIVVSDLVYI